VLAQSIKSQIDQCPGAAADKCLGLQWAAGSLKRPRNAASVPIAQLQSCMHDYTSIMTEKALRDLREQCRHQGQLRVAAA
jgi:hypothetical protein